MLLPNFSADHRSLLTAVPGLPHVFQMGLVAVVIEVLWEGFVRAPCWSLGIERAGALSAGIQRVLEGELRPPKGSF